MLTSAIKKKNTICLSMIVKNESKIIERCLKTVIPLIDYWIICDTGSTDNTIDVIKTFFEGCGIPGEIHQHQWQDFAYNRSRALSLARSKAEYTITIDADEEYTYAADLELLEALTCDHYMILADMNGTLYYRDLLFNNRLEWKYFDVLHEFPDAEGVKTIGYLKSITNVIHFDGASHSDPEKYRRHAEILEAEVIKRPHYARYRYYLAQSYKDARMNEKAIENYLLRTKMTTGFQDEIYTSYLNIGYCMIGLNKPMEEYLVYFFKAFELQSHRLEAPYEIVHNFLAYDMPKSAYNFGITLINQRQVFDVPGGLLIVKRLYDYSFLFEVYIAAYNSGNKHDAVRILKRILDERRYPEDMDQEFKRRWKEINAEINPTTFKDIFNQIYKNNAWGYAAQKFALCSGSGNSQEATMEYRAFLRKYMKENNIRSVLDVGSGIWEFEHDEFICNGVAYIGLDCADAVVEFNREKYANCKNIIFVCEDIMNYDLDGKEYDLIILKDFLQHMTNTDVIRILDRIISHGKHILIMNDANQPADTTERNLITGGYCPLNSQCYPLKRYEPVKLGEYNWKEVSLIRNDNIGKTVMIAILARNKGFLLQTYLSCIYALDYPKDRIILYINTNNNRDNTEDLLQMFVDNVREEYMNIIFEKHSVNELPDDVNPHYWTDIKLTALAKIRNGSLRKAAELGVDYYFIADCDNFVLPFTLKDLIKYNKPIIAPLLNDAPEKLVGEVRDTNFFYATNQEGYLDPEFNAKTLSIMSYEMRGCFEVGLVHCTYLIKAEYLSKLSYTDEKPDKYEFIKFSRNAKKAGISQWICNDKHYGILWRFNNNNITFAEESREFTQYLTSAATTKQIFGLCKIPNYTYQSDGSVLLAILARNKAHVLPLFLQCIGNQDYPKNKICVYINTNNNHDDTLEILKTWREENATKYAAIIFDNIEHNGLESSRPHEWTQERFSILGRIREKSMRRAREMRCQYYFVVDCDNFIRPFTLRQLIKEDKPIIAPMLKSVPEKGDRYSNFFADIDANGYYGYHPDYNEYYDRKLIGTFKVPVVHCTYLIKTECIPQLKYVDGTGRYEFVIFSDSARKNGVGQYLCNKYQFGELLHFYDENIKLEDERKRFRGEYWFPQVSIIALKERRDRMELLEKTTIPILQKSGVKCELTDAFNPLKDDAYDFIRKNGMNINIHPKFNYNTGQIGVYISHYRLWKKMVDENIPEMIIFEDDAIIADNFRNNVEEMMKEADPDYEMIYFYHDRFKDNTTTEQHSTDTDKYTEKYLQPGYETDGLVAYLITRKLAKKLVEHCKNMYREIDLVLKWYLTESKTKFYCSNRKMITHGLTPSSINSCEIFINKKY